MEEKKCKVSFKKSENKGIIKMSGYCTKDKNVNVDIEKQIDLPDFEKMEEMI